MLTGISLFVYTTAKSVYPGLLLLRLFFAVGASASGSMITAILSEISTFRVSPTKVAKVAFKNLKNKTLLFFNKNAVISNNGSPFNYGDDPDHPYRVVAPSSSNNTPRNSTGIAEYNDQAAATTVKSKKGKGKSTKAAAAAYSDNSPEDSGDEDMKASGSSGVHPAPAEPSPWAGDSPSIVPYTPAEDEEDDDIDDMTDNDDGFFDHNDNGADGFMEAVQPGTRNGKGAAMVGIATGLGACFGAFVLLPIPAMLQRNSHGKVSPSSALKISYYIVGGIALLVDAIMLFGLHNDRTKKIMYWITGRVPEADKVALGMNRAEDGLMNNGNSHDANNNNNNNIIVEETSSLSYFSLLKQGFSVALEDPQIALAYCGGFVARSTTVATVMFIPLLISMNFRRSGRCSLPGDDDLPTSGGQLKDTCERAYIISSAVTGVCQTTALVFAPIWGYTSDKFGRKATSLVASIIGIAAYIGFAVSASSDSAFGSKSGSSKATITVFVFGALMGVAQIGTIISSMSLCTDTKRYNSGSIAGVYSFCGGMGILVLSKLGGKLADYWPGAPFMIVAVFYIVLSVITVTKMPVLQEKLEPYIPAGVMKNINNNNGGGVVIGEGEEEGRGALSKVKGIFSNLSWQPSLKNPKTWIPTTHGRIVLEDSDAHFINYDDE